ncbi:nitrite reductase large subunit NirB [Niallia nealsonii]|uniref:Nitrite reductase large subunit n=1 Tax=Niallia nealsonii TaxID=115979 RepID=A0A2N0Z168_9BACI|nr:nitrite reductase large subunit NirB [Niallia nealsonii]PKG23248.1 nitrite reductase large subunit [Niallia nealsonii]
MKKEKLVVIGNGMAGVRCVEEIIKNDPEKFEVSIIGSEPHANYNRIQLSSVLQGDTSLHDIVINDYDWYKNHHINLYSGESAIKVEIDEKTVVTDRSHKIIYDKLIMATGSNPFVLPIPGIEKTGVMTFRTIEDCEKMIESSKKFKKAIVIGGGILGLEAARGLLNLGMEVDVVHNGTYLMQRQLDQTASRLLQQKLEEQGMNFLLGKDSEEIVGTTRVEGIRFKDATFAKADLVVMAVGVSPNISLAKNSGITTNRGIVVNDFMETNMPNIYAVGECAEHNGIVYGLVQPLYEQGKVLAKRICGIPVDGYTSSILSTKLKISGVDVFSVGKVYEEEKAKAIKIFDELDGIYKKVVIEEEKVVGAILFGDTKKSSYFLDMVAKKKDIDNEEKNEWFQTSGKGQDAFMKMPQSEIICNCNGVSKGMIIEAVVQKDLQTVEEIKQCTKASGSCGGCKPLVADLLEYIKSDDFDEKVEVKPMCSCTTLTEEEVVHEMQILNLTSVKEVMAALHWQKKDGCSVCSPAIEYYLGMIYPEYESVQDICFVNEQMNAIRNSDGTYTIIPQMYGGSTTGSQLKIIGEVAQKYKIDRIAISSEQRIHLMGITDENLLAIWNELNMELSSSFGHIVHPIKTNIGEHICSCPKENSLQLAVELEESTVFLSTPYRVKIGISACMHNNSGSTTKDIGLIEIGRGWEIYVGGSSGRDNRSGNLLYVARTKKEAIDIILGFIQYYRETANYLERTWQWVERVNLVHIREVLFDKAIRTQLIDRLEADRKQKKDNLERNFI